MTGWNSSISLHGMHRNNFTCDDINAQVLILVSMWAGGCSCIVFFIQTARMWESWYFDISDVIISYEFEVSLKKWIYYDFTILCFEHMSSAFVCGVEALY
jgi:hypothetical protein